MWLARLCANIDYKYRGSYAVRRIAMFMKVPMDPYFLFSLYHLSLILVSTTSSAETSSDSMITIFITSSGGTNGSYSLECTVTGSNDQPNITWMYNHGTETSSSDAASRTSTVSVTNSSGGSYSSTLTFNPLAASHAGTYTCTAMVNGVVRTANKDVIVVQGK